jgi:hypothetical protein
MRKTYLGGIIMKLITLIRINKELRYYRRELRRERALAKRYGGPSTLADFYEEMVNEYEATRNYLKSKSALV